MEGDPTMADDGTKPVAPIRQVDLVLVVDDEPSIAQSVEFIIEDAGYRVRVAHSGKEALAWTAQQWPAVVISDLMMPLMNGPTFLAALQAQADHWHLPMPGIVIMTAASRRAVVGVPADAVVEKPFDLLTMETAVQTAIHRSAAEGP